MKSSLCLIALALGPNVDAAALFQKQHALGRGVPNSERSDFPESVTRLATDNESDAGSEEKHREVNKSSSKGRNPTPGCDCSKDDPDCDCILGEDKKNPDARVSSGTSKTPQQLLDISKKSSSEEDGDDECECINGKSPDPDCECPPAPPAGEQENADVPCDCERDDPDCDCILGDDRKEDLSADADEAANVVPSSAAEIHGVSSSVNFSNLGQRQAPGMLNTEPEGAVPPVPAPVQPAPAPVVPAPAAVGSGSSSAQVAVAQPVAVDPLQAKYDELMGRIERLRAEIKLWSDHASWNQKIAADKLAVERETTPALADMLADIRYEMHQIAVPVFVEVMTDKLELLLAEQRDLKKQLSGRSQYKDESGEWERFGDSKKKFGDSHKINWPTMLVVFLVGVIVVGLVYTVTQSRRNGA